MQIALPKLSKVNVEYLNIRIATLKSDSTRSVLNGATASIICHVKYKKSSAATREEYRVTKQGQCRLLINNTIEGDIATNTY